MRTIREEELQEWANIRADDAGRLAREFIEFRNEVIEVLEDCETYFDNKADADCGEPNREMVLLNHVKSVLAQAEGRS